MSKELKDLTSAVMNKIHNKDIKMKPKIYFIMGSILTFVGLIFSISTSVFLVGLLRFSLRSHGPMGEYRLDQMISTFPWWTAVVAVLGLVIGVWLLLQYDFSYKIDFRILIAGFILAVLTAGFIIDTVGLNDSLLRQRRTQGMMRMYLDRDDANFRMQNGMNFERR